MDRCSRRLNAATSALVVIDIQEKLLPAMCEPQGVVENAARLVRGAQVLQVPVVVTEQYRKGLGGTVPEVASALGEFAPMEKLTFSACGAAGFVEALKARRVRDVVLCGIEAHVCVTQTCLDLLDEGFRVLVVADATASRTRQNVEIGLERMRSSGALIGSTEMVLFEWLGRAGTEPFKQILNLVK
jgi:nicotinamidase-related amidase